MLKWLTKRAYKSIIEIMQAVYKEIEELQPIDTPTVRWVKSRTGMEAHVIEAPAATSMAKTESVSEAAAVRGHFYLTTRIDSDGQTQVIMVNGQSNKSPEEADPSLISVEYVGAYRGIMSRQVASYEIPTWFPPSDVWSDGTHYIYLVIPFKSQPIVLRTAQRMTSTESIDYKLIGVVEKSGDAYTITQDYIGNSMTHLSYAYANAFKLLQVIDIGIDDYGEDYLSDDSSWLVVNGADLLDSLSGLAFVNRQPYSVAQAELSTDQLPVYVYLKFTAPVRHLPVEVPASAEIAVSGDLMESTDDYLYYLIGELRQAEDGTVMALQAHLTGNIDIDWYGACLGLLEEKSHA